jgi:abequosyltransferase
VRLSICIPTYNRADLLKQALYAFLPQLRPEVQLVICDNASTDHTLEIVANFRKCFSSIIYFRWDNNVGPDLNWLKAVELAHGDFCWLFGSDDVPAENALDAVFDAMDSNADIYLFNRLDCDQQMNPLIARSWLRPPSPPFSLTMSPLASFERYLDSAVSLGSLFSYLSVLVFRKTLWLSTSYNDRFIGSAYIHSSILLSMFRNGAVFTYDPRIIVHCRLGNDSFSSEGRVKRILLDFNGFGMIRDFIFFQHPSVQAGINRILCREYPCFSLIEPLTGIDAQSYNYLRSAFYSAGYSHWCWNLCHFLARLRVPLLNFRKRISQFSILFSTELLIFFITRC